MKNRPLCTVCLFVLIIQSIGLILKGGQGSLPAASIFHILEGNPRITLQGEVYQKKETTENQVYYLKNNSITIQNQIYYESRMIIYVKEADPISIGQSVTLIGELGRFDVAKNPGNFDQRAYYAIDRIYERRRFSAEYWIFTKKLSDYGLKTLFFKHGWNSTKNRKKKQYSIWCEQFCRKVSRRTVNEGDKFR